MVKTHILSLLFMVILAYGLMLLCLTDASRVSLVKHAVANTTNSNDVKGLAALQSKFSSLQNYTGDPCLGDFIPWIWIECSSDKPPRVTVLTLVAYSLVGSLPDFSTMDALQSIDFSSNNLNGPIPDFLGTLPNLSKLKLANNDFSGQIPASLSGNKNLELSVSGNPKLSVIRGKKKKSKLGVILGTTIPILVFFLVIVGILAIVHHKKKSAAVATAAAGQTAADNGPKGAPQEGTMNLEMGGNTHGEAVLMKDQVNQAHQP